MTSYDEISMADNKNECIKTSINSISSQIHMKKPIDLMMMMEEKELNKTEAGIILGEEWRVVKNYELEGWEMACYYTFITLRVTKVQLL